MKTILFVCTGNTCRSPMAEVFANQVFKEQNLPFNAISRGIMAVTSPASANSLEVVSKQNLNLDNHTAKLLDYEDVKNAHLIITMTYSHKNQILSHLPEYQDKVYTLSELSDEDVDIADPFGGSLEEYESCADQIKKYIDVIDFLKFV